MPRDDCCGYYTNLTPKTRVCPQNIVYEQLILSVLSSKSFAKLPALMIIVWKHARFASSGMNSIDRHEKEFEDPRLE